MSKVLDFQPRYDKIVEALLHIAHRKPGIDHYHACKLIYLADYIGNICTMPSKWLFKSPKSHWVRQV